MMYTSGPNPRNPNDRRWEPPEVPVNVTVVTWYKQDNSIVVYEPNVGKPEPCLQTDTWYKLDDCD